MRDDRIVTLSAGLVHFVHWCEHPGCTKWDSSAESADKRRH
jgi:hypothetical protein